MNESVAILAGIGLAAACGFRVFVPLFIASLAANMGFEAFGDLNFRELLGADYEWLGSTPVTIALGVATVVEVAAYYIPWVDNILDSIATPASVLAGSFITSALMPEFLGDGSAKWITSIVAGGGTAGLVQTASVLTRGASTALTGGIGNPLISTAELGGAVMAAGLVVLIPIIGGLCALVFLVYVVRALWRFILRRRAAQA